MLNRIKLTIVKDVIRLAHNCLLLLNMRLWSLHPVYLDTKGLVALWREALLAKAVLKGETKGYKNHPQLKRFRNSEYPVDCINHYLQHVHNESVKRGYHFNRRKIDPISHYLMLTVTDKQIEYELMHLLKKLKARNKSQYMWLSSQSNIAPHPLFKISKGEIEDWEIT